MTASDWCVPEEHIEPYPTQATREAMTPWPKPTIPPTVGPTREPTPEPTRRSEVPPPESEVELEPTDIWAGLRVDTDGRVDTPIATSERELPAVHTGPRTGTNNSDDTPVVVDAPLAMVEYHGGVPTGALEAAGIAAPVADLTPREVGGGYLFASSVPGASDFQSITPTVEELLELGWFGSGASPTHIALRGIPETGSIRCEWAGIARTLAQREQRLRFLLGSILADDAPLPPPADLETIIDAVITATGVEFGWKEQLEASYVPLATGGLNNEFLNLYCYVDYVVSEYLVGAGPAKVTVAYDLLRQEFSHDVTVRIFETYQDEFEAEGITRDQVPTRAKYDAENLDPTLLEHESYFEELVAGRDSVLFLAPVAAYDNVSIEAWQAITQWDLQDDDGTLQAVRYSTHLDSPEYQQTLANLKSRIAAAATVAGFEDARVSSVSELPQTYEDMGAYEDITPGDGDPTGFIPVEPLPVQVCTDSMSMGMATSQALTRDCSVLLDLQETLEGTATLNWSKNAAIASWTSVTLGSTPQRVTGLDLSSESLTGTVPAGLGRLHGLTSLDLSGNSLTGSIPAALGDLPELATLRLTGNSLSGCIPAALRDVATNDLATLAISFCDMLTLPSAPSGVTLALTNGVFTINWDAVSGADNYEAQHRITNTNGAWTPLPETMSTSVTHTPTGGLACGTTYGFRVRAYGDGVIHSADWGAPSDEVTHTTEACN